MCGMLSMFVLWGQSVGWSKCSGQLVSACVCACDIGEDRIICVFLAIRFATHRDGVAAVCAPPSEGNTVALVYPPPSSPWSTGSPVMRMSEQARNHSCGPQPTPCVPSSQ